MPTAAPIRPGKMMRHRRPLRALALRAFALAAALPAITTPGLAQQPRPSSVMRPELFIEVQDGYGIGRVPDGPGDTARRPTTASASYEFVEPLRATDGITYAFNECTRNGARVRLLAWHLSCGDRSTRRMPADSNRTETLRLAAGDTLRFRREITWSTLATPPDAAPPDTLSFLVELVRERDGARLALLDSITVAANPDGDAPVIGGMRTMDALVEYAVPRRLAGTAAFIGIRPWSPTDPELIPPRRSAVALDALRQPQYVPWSRRIGIGRAVHIDSLPRTDGHETMLEAEREAAGLITIRFSPSDYGASCAVAIVDERGRIVAVPYTTRELVAPSSVRWRDPDGRGRSVALAYDGVVVRRIPLP